MSATRPARATEAAWTAVDRAHPWSGLPGGLPSPSLRVRAASSKLERENGCRLCSRGAGELTRHHLVPEVWFRLRRRSNPALFAIRNASANIVPLCRGCHDLVETNESARRRLRARLGQDEIVFSIQTIGRAWLEWTYPAK